MTLNKQELRQILLKQRRALSEQVWRRESDRLVHRLFGLPLFREAQTILAYFSFRQEPDLSPLFSSNSNSNRKWGFPRCVGKSLIWHIWEPGDTLEKGAYGILEPPITSPKVNPVEVDLILVPAVACDRKRYRLGYGGGFYDRMLSSPEWENKPTIGIVFDFAYIPQLPVDPWDKKLDEICTEKNNLIS